MHPRLAAITLAAGICVGSVNSFAADPKQHHDAPPPAKIQLGSGGLRAGLPWAFTPDDTGLFTQSQDSLELWDTLTGRHLRSYPAGRQIWSYGRSADGKTIAGSAWKQIFVWDVATGKQKKIVDCAHGFASNPVLSADGNLLAYISSEARTICIYDIAAAKETATFSVQETDGSPSLLQFSPDGSVLAEGGTGVGMGGNVPKPFSTVRLWDLHTQKIRGQGRFDEGGSPSLAFSPDGKRLVTGGTGLHLWDVAAAKEIAKIDPNGENHFRMTFSADGKSLHCLTLSNVTSTAERYDIADAAIKLATAVTLDRQCTALSDDGRYAAYGETAAAILDAETGKPAGTDVGPTASTRVVAFTDGGKSLVTVCEDGSAYLWDTTTGTLQKTIPLQTGRIRDGAVSADGKTLNVTDDMRMYGYDLPTGAQLFVARPMIGRRVTLAVMSPDGTRVAAAGRLFDMQGDWGLYVWDNRLGGQPKMERGVTTFFAQSICWSPDSVAVAMGCADGTVRFFNTITAAEQITLRLPGEPAAAPLPAGNMRRSTEKSVTSIDISPDGRVLVASMMNGDLVWWETANGHLIRIIPKATLVGARVHFDPRGFALAALDIAGKITFFETSTGLAVTSLDCEVNINCWSISPDGQWIATGSDPAHNAIWRSPLAGPATRPADGAAIDDVTMQKLWTDLADKDAGKAFAAAGQFAAAGAPALKFLAARLVWNPPSDAIRAKAADLIDGLSADEYQTRRTSEKQLRDLGGEAHPLIVEALKNPATIDARLSLERILNHPMMTAEVSQEDARLLRAIAAVEQIGGPEAYAVVQGVWVHTTSNRAAEDARAALPRMAAKLKPPGATP